MRNEAFVGLLAPALLGVALISGLGGCLRPAPAPVGPERGALGISVENRWESTGFFAETPEWVHFVRWNDKGDAAAQTEVVTTNFFRDNRAYLLNVRPGRYAVIATTEVARREKAADERVADGGGESRPRGAIARRAEESGSGPRFVRASFSGAGPLLARTHDPNEGATGEIRIMTTYLSDEMIRRTMVEVAPGGFTFAGHLAVQRDHGITQGDRAVNHFHPLENPTLLDHSGVIVVPAVESASRGTRLKIERGRDATAGFLAQALRDLEGSGWVPAVRRALERVGEK